MREEKDRKHFETNSDEMQSNLVLLQGYFQRNGISPIQAYGLMRLMCWQLEQDYGIEHVEIGVGNTAEEAKQNARAASEVDT